MYTAALRSNTCEPEMLGTPRQLLLFQRGSSPVPLPTVLLLMMMMLLLGVSGNV